MQRRITYLIAAYSLALLCILYLGLRPNIPKVTSIDSVLLEKLTSQLKATYPEVGEVDGELFNNILEFRIVFNGDLDDAKAESILRSVKSLASTYTVVKIVPDGMSIYINNKLVQYRYSSIVSPNIGVNKSKFWNMEKTEFIGNKENISKSIFQE